MRCTYVHVQRNFQYDESFFHQKIEICFAYTNKISHTNSIQNWVVLNKFMEFLWFWDCFTVPIRSTKMINHQTICDASNECFLLISRKFSHLMHISRSSFIIAVLTASSRRRVIANWKAFFCSAFGIKHCSNDDSPPRKMIEWFLSCVYHDKWESVLSRIENEAQQCTTRKNALDN